MSPAEEAEIRAHIEALGASFMHEITSEADAWSWLAPLMQEISDVFRELAETHGLTETQAARYSLGTIGVATILSTLKERWRFASRNGEAEDIAEQLVRHFRRLIKDRQIHVARVVPRT